MNDFKNKSKEALDYIKRKENKDKFLKLINENVSRKIDLSFLECSDFFSAPCSMKYHLCIEGGLCAHSLNVYDALLSLCCLHDIDINDKTLETITIVSLFHDLCKANFYKLNLSGYGHKYTCENDFPFGHGEKSVLICLRELKLDLTEEEMLAIRFHMGNYDDAVKSNVSLFNEAQKKSKLVTLLHLADMYATHITERGI